MRTILVTGSDTGVGKTWVTAHLVRALAERGAKVQVVKVVETGISAQRGQVAHGNIASVPREAGASAADQTAKRGQVTDGNILVSTPAGDAVVAAQGLAGVEAHTLFSFEAALAPAAAARAEGKKIVWSELVERTLRVRLLTPDSAETWRIYEGAGGIASPIDAAGHDWADFAAEMGVEQTVIVVPERLGAINHARLCWAHARAKGLNVGIWLNPMEAVPEEVSQSTRAILQELSIPLWSFAEMGGARPAEAAARRFSPPESGEPPLPPSLGRVPPLSERLAAGLAERERLHQRRQIRVTPPVSAAILNLSDNDYLDLARDPALIAAAANAAQRYGTSASASPLITGWKEPHAALVDALCAWHGFPCGLLWTSGYAANCAVLGTLPEKGDLILADRLIHHSMIAGLGRSGARFKRYPHLDLDRLEAELGGANPPGTLGPTAFGLARAASVCGASAPPTTFVVTESVFSMDGDYPDLARLAALKAKYPFFLILDEAHALGWYGVAGAGLASAAGMAGAVDVFVGTLGKTLASGGAYTLFRDEAVRDTLINHAGEFIYSTAIPPAAAAVATAAIERIRELAVEQSVWQAGSHAFRGELKASGWSALEGESPIVPVLLNEEAAALSLAAALRDEGIWTAAVRPPTVPTGTSRLRFSLKRGFGAFEAARVIAAMGRWRDRA